jgi:hypothetical protein
MHFLQIRYLLRHINLHDTLHQLDLHLLHKAINRVAPLLELILSQHQVNYLQQLHP